MSISTIGRDLGADKSIDNVLRTLREQVGLTDQEIATATGANERSVRRWYAGIKPNTDKAKRIDDLRLVASELGIMLDPPSIAAWLRNRNPVLGRQRPLDLLAERNGFNRVVAAVDSLLGGDFG
jgi:transcriptional regulator with XRE-family HTH domain